MLGSRGCPFNCKFCDFKFNPLGGEEKVFGENPGVRGFRNKNHQCPSHRGSQTTSSPRIWIGGRVCDLIIAAGIKKKFAINARLEVAKRPDVLEKMYKAGFMAFLMGIESAHDKTLASMNKGFTTAKVREYFETLRRFNIIYHCYFIIGNIGESREEMMDIVRFSHELGADTLGLSVLRATKYPP